VPCRAGPGNDINAVTGFRKAPTRGRASLVAFRALTRPVPGDGVQPVVDMRDTAIVGHRNFAIEHDLACLPGHAADGRRRKPQVKRAGGFSSLKRVCNMRSRRADPSNRGPGGADDGPDRSGLQIERTRLRERGVSLA
jgi:hypothetical protein